LSVEGLLPQQAHAYRDAEFWFLSASYLGLTPQAIAGRPVGAKTN